MEKNLTSDPKQLIVAFLKKFLLRKSKSRSAPYNELRNIITPVNRILSKFLELKLDITDLRELLLKAGFQQKLKVTTIPKTTLLQVGMDHYAIDPGEFDILMSVFTNWQGTYNTGAEQLALKEELEKSITQFFTANGHLGSN